MLPWLICLALGALSLVLLGRLWLLRRSLDDIAGQLGELLSADTNVPIVLSTRDPHVRALASELNVRLRELRRARRRYENGDRELREAVTNVSHDLRTPLTALCGYLELLERREHDPDAARYLALMGERAERMKHLTGELLHYCAGAGSEPGAAPAEPVDLNAALEESVGAFYAPLKERGIEPVVRMPRRRVVRTLERESLERVLGNLLSNALKYSAGDLEITLTETGELSFENAAPELDSVQVGRLFDRFFTLDSGRGSTGLGLSIARSLAGRMGGSLTACCRDGRLRLCLTLPETQET